MTTQTLDPSAENTKKLENKIDKLQDQISILVEHQMRQRDLLDELVPITREMMDAMTVQLGDLEKRGYFSFGKASLNILDKIVTSYNEEDLEDLGQNIVSILDTVRSVTRPEILQVAHEATEAIREADKTEPLSPWGAFRQASGDKDVRHGVAVMVSVLRHLGKATRRASHENKLGKIGPPRISAPRQATGRPKASPQTTANTRQVAAQELDSSAWTREAAVAMAVSEGIGPLGDTHWALIEFARKEFLETGASPNVRRLSKGSGIGIRELYQAFPTSPGVAIAKLAGVPKPKGCI